MSLVLPEALTTSVLEYLSSLPDSAVEQWVTGLSPSLLEEVQRGEWWFVRRPNQTAPPGDWFIWLILAGRGFGKNRTASEWLIDKVTENPVDVAGHPTEWAAVGETLQDARKAMFGGPSGMINVLARKRIRYRYQRFPAPTITLADGQIIHGLGADDEDVGRGLNLAGAWLDELAKWRKPELSWSGGLAPALRTKMPGGTKPQVLATTTPKPISVLKDWTTRTDGSVVVTRGSTFDNAANLSAAAVKEFVRQYGRSQLGRQELYGELLTVVEGALWRHDWLEELRIRRRRDVPALSTVAIAIDPAVSDKMSSDETGLIAVGRGIDGHDYVLADRSGQFVGVEAARRAWQLYLDTAADVVVYETNQGGDWVRDVLRTAWNEMRDEGLVGGNAPLQGINATRGKRLRAEPVAARYEAGECVAEGSPVLTERGEVPIETVTAGDRVWTRKGWQSVSWAGQTAFRESVRVIAEDGYELTCTADHPVWTETRGWVHAGALSPTDTLLTWSTTAAPTAGDRSPEPACAAPRSVGVARRVLRVEPGPTVPLYDLTVPGCPEFIASGVLVHNCHHVGRFEKLELQMTEWLPSSKTSPDRLDALVHAIAYLSVGAIVEAEVGSPLTSSRPLQLPSGARVVFDPHAPRRALGR